MGKARGVRTRSGSAVLFCVLTVWAALAHASETKLPAQLQFLPSLGEVRKTMEYERWGEFAFAPDNAMRRGEHWNLLVNLKGGWQEKEPIWAAMKPVFLKNGWTVAKEFPAGSSVVSMTYKQNGVEAWAAVDMMSTVVRVNMILVGPPPVSLTLAAPAAMPEKMAATTGDFPYLAPLPGSKLHRGWQEPAPFWVTPNGASQQEMIAPSSLMRSYRLPDLSNVMFLTVYREALTKAGWEIVNEFNGADAALTAHYAKNGRNIWASLHNNAEGYDIAVANNESDLSASLAKSCHVALYGVLFDFNKSTLQPVSDGVLQPVASLMAKDKTLKLEVQGHTDNVGGDAYNQKLSEERAQAVVVWLTAHGVAADRLSSKGYGKTVPVADNNSDQGRAKNRRVEIADPRCAK